LSRSYYLLALILSEVGYKSKALWTKKPFYLIDKLCFSGGMILVIKDKRVAFSSRYEAYGEMKQSG
jgi:hypothetical protein